MSEFLSSAQNPRIHLVNKLLNQAKTRRKEGLFVAEGVRLVSDGFSSGMTADFVFYRQEHSPKAEDLLGQIHFRTQLFELDNKLFDSLSDTENSQGILGVFKIREQALPETLDFIVVLDQLRDPGNLGTIMRTAEAAGVQALFCPPGTVDPWSPKVVRSGMGAHFRLPIYEWGWEALGHVLDGISAYEADMDGSLSCWQADFRKKTALVIGGEADGISSEARSYITQTLRIPMQGKTESLNAAVSASILMFEVARQRSL